MWTCVGRLHIATVFHMLIEENYLHIESRLIGINFNLINNFQLSQKVVNLFPLELTQIKECHEREREEERKHFHISAFPITS